MSEQEIKVGDTVRLLIDYNGRYGRVGEVVEATEAESLMIYKVSVDGVSATLAAYEVEKIAAVQEVVNTLEELEGLPKGTTLWSSDEGKAAGTGKPYLQVGVRNESGESVWHSYADSGVRDGHQIRLPAIVVYKPVAEITESVKE